jgi:hypothetical protein
MTLNVFGRFDIRVQGGGKERVTGGGGVLT